MMWGIFIFFEQKTAYELRISDWSSDVCSSDVDHQVDADREGGDGRPGDERGRNAENDAVPVVLHDAAPVGLRRLDAEAEEGERREEQHRESEAQAELSEQRRKGIGPDLANERKSAGAGKRVAVRVNLGG